MKSGFLIGGIYGIRKTTIPFRQEEIIEELLFLNLYLNPAFCRTNWNHIMFQFAKAGLNLSLSLFLNISIQSLKNDGNRIESGTGWHLAEDGFYAVQAGFFTDCSVFL